MFKTGNHCESKLIEIIMKATRTSFMNVLEFVETKQSSLMFDSKITSYIRNV